MTTELRLAPTGQILQLLSPLAAYGAQTSWAIDPSTGDDAGPGTPAFPLRTMGEFNARMLMQLVQPGVAQTLQCVGDVLDAPLWLVGTRYASGASLTVSGTRTQRASTTVTTVTQLGNAGVGYPFQFVTSGIDWTTFPVGSQVRMTASGAIGRIMSVTDANTAILGPFLTAVQANITPANGDAFTVESLSRAQPPIINATAQSTGAGASAPSLILRDFSFDGDFSQSYTGALDVKLIGCEIKGGAAAARECQALVSVFWQSCRWTLSGGSYRIRSGSGVIQNINGCVVAGNTFILSTGGSSLFRVGFNSAPLSLFSSAFASLSDTNHRNTNTPITINDGARIYASGVAAGATGNTGIGIDCARGSYAWQGASAKPTVTGSTPGTNDVRIGGSSGTTMGYTALGTGFYAFFNNANPNSILNLVGPGGGAWMAQS